MGKNVITARAVIVGTVFAAIFAVVTVYILHLHSICATATQIPVLPYVLLFVLVLLINPICWLSRMIKPFSPAEIILVFCMGMVSSGISTFGLSAQLVPIASSLFNRHWNTEQSEWDRYVVPFMNEQFFVAERGIQAEAVRYRSAYFTARDARRILETAQAVDKSRQGVAAAEEALRAAQAETAGASEPRALTIARAEQTLRSERNLQAENQGRWQALTAAQPLDRAAVCRDYPARVTRLEAEAAARRGALLAITSNAFERVESFRRGLPKSLRAVPGIIPTGEDSFTTYAGRIRRLRYGQQALRALCQAHDAAGTAAGAAARLRRAQEALAPVGDTNLLTAAREVIGAELAAAIKNVEDNGARIRELSAQGREATPEKRRSIEGAIARLSFKAVRLNKRNADWKAKTDAVYREIEIVAGVQVIGGEIGALADRIAGGTLPAADVRAGIRDLMTRLSRMDTSLRSFFIGYVPWSYWIKPLLLWGALIGLTYIVLMTFNILIYRQWAHNEKLVYPLAEVPQFLAGAKEHQERLIPAIYRSGFFWIGFAISAATLSWNLLCVMQVIPGLTALNLANSWTPYITNTNLQGLLPSARSMIFFTMIGFSFLIPQKVSFSLWFFTVLGMVQLLILVWSGYGVNEYSFPMDWWYTFNFRTAEGCGALVVFASVVLFRCRKYILAAFSPSSVSRLEPDEQKELRVSSFLFLLSSLGVILMIWRGLGANLYYTIFAYLVIMVITIGLVRAVAEGGIIGFQAWISPFHFIRAYTGYNKTWTAPSLFMPVMVFYSVLFLDIKTFIAPAMANALKLRDDLRLKRFKFHMVMAFTILLAAVIAVAAEIIFGYSLGGDKLNSWFYQAFPQSTFDEFTNMSKNPPVPSPAQAGWVVTGAVVMGLLLYFRRFLFWLPHPIGLIMLVNPIMASYWFSILIGWLVKTLVTKYGNQETYAKAQYLFIGLVAGELILVALSMFVSYSLNIRVGIDLNRNWM
jgi:hypothetical protein